MRTEQTNEEYNQSLRDIKYEYDIAREGGQPNPTAHPCYKPETMKFAGLLTALEILTS